MAHRMGRTGRTLRRSGAVAAIVSAFVALAAASANAAPLVWIANPSTESVSTIDSGTGKPSGSPIQFEGGSEGVGPVSIAITPNGRQAVLVGGEAGAMTVIDTANRRVVKEFGGALFSGRQVAISPDGKAAYLTEKSTGSTLGGEGVWSIDPEYPGNIQPISVGGESSAIAITPDGDYAYVGVAPESVKTIYTPSHQVVGEPIAVGGIATSIVFTPDGATAYVIAEGVKGVEVIDTARGEVVKTIAVGAEPSSIAVSPDGKRLYIGIDSVGSGTIATAETATNMIVGKSIVVPAGVKEIALSPDGKTIWVAGSQVSRVTLAGEKVEAVAGTGETSALVVAPDQSPTAVFTAPSSVPFGTPVAFDGTASTDPDGSIASWKWSFGDGFTGAGATTAHNYSAPGTYGPKLNVVDNEGCSDPEVFTGRTAYCSGSAPASRVVTVTAPPTVVAPPSNKFRVGRVQHNRHNGTVRMQVKLPSAGFILLFGNKVHAVTRKSKAAQTMWLTIHARVELNKRLKKVLRAPVQIRLTFTPNGGTAKTVHRTVVLQRTARHKAKKHHRH
jgi:YVTN family beta-propeller protein